MLRKTILCAAAAALFPTPALAHPGGGGGMGGPPAGIGGMGNAGGFSNIGGLGGMNNIGVTTRDTGRINSQGPAHASATGIDHANSNSVLAGTSSTKTVTAGALAGLTTGATIFSNGTAVGTVQQIRTNGSGAVVVVIVKGTNGGLFAVPANKLSFSGGTLSTTARFAGINTTPTLASNSQARLHSQALLHASPTGIAHANVHSVLASGVVVSGSLAGLTTGLTVKNSGGTTLGTVSQIVTDSSGNIRLVIVTSSTGQTIRLVPSTLTLSGGVVTTTMVG